MRNTLRRIVPSLALVAGLAFGAQSAPAADIIINNVDFPGEGFNDPTPAHPVGGNPGTTLGEQRLAVFQAAADIWGATLESDVTIVVQGINVPLACSPDSGVLGAAGTIQIFANDDPAPPGILPLIWYHSALYNKITGEDASPGPPDPDFLVPPFNDDIFALFNTELGTPDCLTDSGWYYGLDNHAAPNEIDFLTVVLHEFAHGLGFSEFVDEDTGEGPQGLSDIYSTNMLDTTLGKTWDELTPPERVASQTNTGNLVWAGAHVTAAAPDVLGPRPTVGAYAPRRGRAFFEAQAATFGPPLGSVFDAVGFVELVDDGAGDSPTDACEPLENSMVDRIALIDRGACSFTVKVKNAEDAGARGAIVVNNVAGGLPPMGGTDETIHIRSAGISQEDGKLLKAALPGGRVIAGLYLDPRFTAGADADGNVRLYAPGVVEPGSSKSHWDTTATPNLLMEPFINSDLRPVDDLDLTPDLFLDLGWTLVP